MRKRIFLNLLIFLGIIILIYKAFNTIETKKDTTASSNNNGIVTTNTLERGEINKLERKIAEQKLDANVIAGVYIPNTIINYPVVKGDDNEFYINKDINGNNDVHGAIFMDFMNKADNSDKNTIIYGHNMKDGTMFTDLCKYKERKFFNENRYIYLCTSKGLTKWEIFSAYVTPKEYLNYTCVDFRSNIHYGNFLKVLKQKSKFMRDVSLDKNDRILTLQTSSYEYKGAKFVVHAKLINNQ